MGNINHNHCNKYGIKTEESLHHKQKCSSGKINAGGNVTFAITGSITTIPHILQKIRKSKKKKKTGSHIRCNASELV